MEPDFIRDELTEEQLTWDIPHWKFFRKTVIDLVNSGKHVGIASFGMYKIIRAYMDRIFGINQKYFTVVNTFARCKIDEPLQQNKNGYILNIMEHYRITSPDRVLLFDDLGSNIAAAMELGFVGILVEGVQYKNGRRECKGLFGPKQMTMMEKQLRSSLNSSNPLHIAQLGHVGDRKVSIEMYGRRDKCPMNMKQYIYPDSLFSQHFNKEIDNNIYKKVKHTEAEKPVMKSIDVDKCTDCEKYSPSIYLVIFLLIIILIMVLYFSYKNMFQKN